MPTLYRSGIRRGPKFEVTLDMAVENIRTVAQRLGVTALSQRQYCAHGSFHSRSLTKKWAWTMLCALAGLASQLPGRRRQPRKPCIECNVRMSRTIGRLCRTCVSRMHRLEHWGK